MRDFWIEIWIAIRANKLRTFLTGFSIAWGIFMLIVLLASGDGLNKGMSSNFNHMSKNSISVGTGRTSLPYNGLQSNRRLFFRADDLDYIEGKLEHVVYFTPEYRESVTLIRGTNSEEITIKGTRPGFEKMKSLILLSGRFLNEIDEKEKRKVVLIPKATAELMFKGEDPIGKSLRLEEVSYQSDESLRLAQISFQVVGVYDEESASWRATVYAPFTTVNTLYNPSEKVSRLSMMVEGINNLEESEAFAENLNKLLSRRLNYHPDDQEAVWIHDRITENMNAQAIFNGISLFIWIIGLGTLIAGIVGVSNIMLITVRERTKEFGIRKALGATPISILKLVMVESLTITAIFGYIGLLFGVLLVELVNLGISSDGGGGSYDEPTMFLNPSVDIEVALVAMLILVVAGLVSGYIPAKRAVSIKPITALQAD